MKKYLDLPIVLELIDGYVLKADKTDELKKIAEQEIKKRANHLTEKQKLLWYLDEYNLAGMTYLGSIGFTSVEEIYFENFYVDENGIFYKFSYEWDRKRMRSWSFLLFIPPEECAEADPRYEPNLSCWQRFIVEARERVRRFNHFQYGIDEKPQVRIGKGFGRTGTPGWRLTCDEEYQLTDPKIYELFPPAADAVAIDPEDIDAIEEERKKWSLEQEKMLYEEMRKSELPNRYADLDELDVLGMITRQPVISTKVKENKSVDYVSGDDGDFMVGLCTNVDNCHTVWLYHKYLNLEKTCCIWLSEERRKALADLYGEECLGDEIKAELPDLLAIVEKYISRDDETESMNRMAAREIAKRFIIPSNRTPGQFEYDLTGMTEVWVDTFSNCDGIFYRSHFYRDTLLIDKNGLFYKLEDDGNLSHDKPCHFSFVSPKELKEYYPAIEAQYDKIWRDLLQSKEKNAKKKQIHFKPIMDIDDDDIPF